MRVIDITRSNIDMSRFERTVLIIPNKIKVKDTDIDKYQQISKYLNSRYFSFEYW